MVKIIKTGVELLQAILEDEDAKRMLLSGDTHSMIEAIAIITMKDYLVHPDAVVELLKGRLPARILAKVAAILGG